jgi:hypothetical protein
MWFPPAGYLQLLGTEANSTTPYCFKTISANEQITVDPGEVNELPFPNNYFPNQNVTFSGNRPKFYGYVTDKEKNDQ